MLDEPENTQQQKPPKLIFAYIADIKISLLVAEWAKVFVLD